MDYQKLANVIDRSVRERVERHAPHIRLGTVAKAGDRSVSVTIDGSDSPATIVKACQCAAGDRVVILKEGTQFYAVARVGG